MRVFKRGIIEQKPELIYVAEDKKFSSTSEAIRYERKKQEKQLFANPTTYLERIENLKQRVEASSNLSLKNRLNSLENIFYTELETRRHAKIME